MLAGRRFLQNYFDGLFIKKDLSFIDKYMDQEYFDYDIGPSVKDHIKNSKEFLKDIFEKQPNLRVIVKKVKRIGSILCAQLQWVIIENRIKKLYMEGIATFEIKKQKIRKRNTLIYIDNSKD